jgi:SAM-dependent methyltransferase
MMKLHLGCGRTRLEGYVNVDVVRGPAVDLVMDFDACGAGGAAFPYADNSVEESLGRHLIEHLRNPLPFMQELWRVTRPGGVATFHCPYGSSDDAFEDPTHVRQYFLHSWGYFSQPFYWRADYGYRGDWDCRQIVLELTAAKFANRPADEIMEAVMSKRNVVLQMRAELVAVKPPRPPDAALIRHAPVELNLR